MKDDLFNKIQISFVLKEEEKESNQMNIKSIMKRLWIIPVSLILFYLGGISVLAADNSHLADNKKQSIDLPAGFSDYEEKLKEVLQDMDEETLDDVFTFLKEQVESENLNTEQGMHDAIEAGKEKLGVVVNESDIREALVLMNTLEEMGFKPEAILDKAESLYQEYGVDFLDHSQEIIVDAVKESLGSLIKKAIGDFFSGILESIKNFFSK